MSAMKETTTMNSSSIAGLVDDQDLSDFVLEPRNTRNAPLDDDHDRSDEPSDDDPEDLQDFDLKPRKKSKFNKKKFDMSFSDDDEFLRRDSVGSLIIEPRQVNYFILFKNLNIYKFFCDV